MNENTQKLKMRKETVLKYACLLWIFPYSFDGKCSSYNVSLNKQTNFEKNEENRNFIDIIPIEGFSMALWFEQNNLKPTKLNILYVTSL